MNTLKVLFLGTLLLLGLAADAQSYQIGHATRTFVDNSRGGREILTEIYYPANTAGEMVPVASPVGDPFPVIVFAHGFVIRWDAYDYLWQDLVPQGYILLFPRTEGQLLPAPDHQAFAEDMNFLANRVQVLRGNPGSPVYNKASDKTALMGHSMGGGATYLAAANNPFITTTVSWAAAETSPSAIAAAADVSVPSLVIAGAEDCVSPTGSNQVPIYNDLQLNTSGDCKSYVELTGASHCNFTNGSATLCYTGEGFPCLFYGPFISRADQNARTLAVLNPWFDTFLKGDCSAWTNYQSVLATGDANGELTYLTSCAAPCLSPPERLLSKDEFAKKVFISPNPVSDRLTISLSLGMGGEIQVELFDLTGRLQKEFGFVVTAGQQSITLPALSELKQGIYLLRISGAYNGVTEFIKE